MKKKKTKKKDMSGKAMSGKQGEYEEGRRHCWIARRMRKERERWDRREGRVGGFMCVRVFFAGIVGGWRGEGFVLGVCDTYYQTGSGKST